MSAHDHRRVTALVLSLGLSLGGGEPQVRGSEGPGSDYRAALEIARTRGVPVVVIVTARAVPASLRLWDEFHDGPWVRASRACSRLRSSAARASPSSCSRGMLRGSRP